MASQRQSKAKRQVQIEYVVVSRDAVKSIRAFARANDIALKQVNKSVRDTFPAWRSFKEQIGGIADAGRIFSGTLSTLESIFQAQADQERILRRTSNALRDYGLDAQQAQARARGFADSVRAFNQEQSIEALSLFADTAQGLGLSLEQVEAGASLAIDIMFQLGESAESATRDLAEVMAGGVEPLEQWVRGSRELVEEIARIPDPADRAARAMEVLREQFQGAAQNTSVADERLRSFEESRRTFETGVMIMADTAVRGVEAVTTGVAILGDEFLSLFGITDGAPEAGNAFDAFATRSATNASQAADDINNMATAMRRTFQANAVVATFAGGVLPAVTRAELARVAGIGEAEALTIPDEELRQMALTVATLNAEVRRELFDEHNFGEWLGIGDDTKQRESLGAITQLVVDWAVDLQTSQAEAVRQAIVGPFEQAAGGVSNVLTGISGLIEGGGKEPPGPFDEGPTPARPGRKPPEPKEFEAVGETLSTTFENASTSVVGSIGDMGFALGKFITSGERGAEQLGQAFKSSLASTFSQIGSAAQSAAGQFLLAGSFGPFGLFFGLGLAANLFAGLLSGGGGGGGGPAGSVSAGVEPADVIAGFAPQLRGEGSIVVNQEIGASFAGGNRSEARRSVSQLVAEGVDFGELTDRG